MFPYKNAIYTFNVIIMHHTIYMHNVSSTTL